jgi:hypothetical protein
MISDLPFGHFYHCFTGVSKNILGLGVNYVSVVAELSASLCCMSSELWPAVGQLRNAQRYSNKNMSLHKHWLYSLSFILKKTVFWYCVLIFIKCGWLEKFYKIELYSWEMIYTPCFWIQLHHTHVLYVLKWYINYKPLCFWHINDRNSAMASNRSRSRSEDRDGDDDGVL